MAINFPNSPSNDDIHTVGSQTFVYKSSIPGWQRQVSGVNLSSVAQDILPDTDSSRDLGSPTKKWKDLHLSGNTIFLGDSGSISASTGGEIILPSIKIGTGDNAVKLEADGSGKLRTKKVVGGVTQAAEEPGNATVVTDMTGLVALTGMSTGQIALVSALNRVFMYTGTGWFKIADMTNATPTDITGVNATYDLATDGTATTITAVSTDPEGFALTWSYAVTTGSLGSTATVSQADNVFTVTPSTDSAHAGSFGITFSVTDGATGAVSAVSAFTLQFASWATGAVYLTTLEAPSAYRTPKGSFGAYFGANSVISGDGLTIAVYQKYTSNPAVSVTDHSEVYIYTLVGGSWTAQATLRPPTSAQYDAWGEYLDISSDGNTLLVGIASGAQPREVTILTRSSGVWSTEDTFNINNFAAASLTASGDTAVFRNGVNTVEVWSRSGSVWSQQAVTYPSTGGDMKDLKISGDGTTIVGTQGTLNTNGRIFSYTYDGTSWTSTFSSSPTIGTISGYQVWYVSKIALSNDGSIVAVEQHQGSTGGLVHILALSSGSWSSQATLRPASYTSATTASPSPNFGQRLAMNGDGTNLVVGAPREPINFPSSYGNEPGAIYFFVRSGSSWTEASRNTQPSTGYPTNYSETYGTQSLDMDSQGVTCTVDHKNYGPSQSDNIGGVHVLKGG